MFTFMFLAVSFFFFLSFPMYKSPSSLAAVLVLISGVMVTLMGVISSFWFSYILFLVYIGGLLVMFIYVCLVSSNYPFRLDFTYLIGVLLTSCFISFLMDYSKTKTTLGGSSFISGTGLVEDSSVSLFVFLVVLLLVMLLVIVRSTGSGAVIVSEKS
uniref:NADH dehydrogenase subunit 6 n=1 Tax=Ascobulla fragilis TaxID=195875 RepID=B3DFB5_ASCFR|nr:NADH dehydrogenase subunit 6 [Ascobulla fragilis]ACE62802.1 NADH dehydrogenase subunit 6 [Ascobulla fragilis]